MPIKAIAAVSTVTNQRESIFRRGPSVNSLLTEFISNFIIHYSLSFYLEELGQNHLRAPPIRYPYIGIHQGYSIQ